MQSTPRSRTHLRDTALHDEEIGVVDVQLHALEERLNGLLRRLMPVEEVLGDIGDGNLRRLSFQEPVEYENKCTPVLSP